MLLRRADRSFTSFLAKPPAYLWTQNHRRNFSNASLDPKHALTSQTFFYRNGEIRRLPKLDDSPVTSMSAGIRHSCAVVDGHLVTWGANDYGQCGPVNESLWASLTLANARGDEDDVPEPTLASGVFPEGTRLAQVASGYWHNLALTDSGKVFSWGAGILGHGKEVYDISPAVIEQFELMEGRGRWRSVHAGPFYSLATFQTNKGSDRVYAWGYLPKPGTTIVEGVGKVLRPSSIGWFPLERRVQCIGTACYHFGIVSLPADGSSGPCWVDVFGHRSPFRNEGDPPRMAGEQDEPYCPFHLDIPTSEMFVETEWKPVWSFSFPAAELGTVKQLEVCSEYGDCYLLTDKGNLFRVPWMQQNVEASVVEKQLPSNVITSFSQTGRAEWLAVTRDGAVLRRRGSRGSWTTLRREQDVDKAAIQRVHCGFDFALLTTRSEPWNAETPAQK